MPRAVVVRSLRRLLLAGALASLPAVASAETFTVGPGDDLVSILEGLQPGDEVVVDAGTYATGGFVAVTWSGTESEPIVVRAADGVRPVLQGVPEQNVLNIDGTHFELRGFEITGGSHGLRLGNVSHAVFEDLVVHGVLDVGISCNRPGHVCDDIVVRDTEIYDTGVGGSGPGEGMYLGCNDAACTVSNSLFERNFIHDTAGGAQGDGLELKTGSHSNVVRDNVILATKYPAITLYGFDPAIPGAEPNVVERNFVAGTVDNGIQIVGQVVVRNNIVIDAGVNGIHAKPSQGFLPDDAIIVHNTIVGAGNACFKSNDWGGTAGQLVANNAFYCPESLAIDFNGGTGTDTLVAGNVVLGSSNAPSGGAAPGTSLAGDLGDPAAWLFYPPPGSALVDAGDAAHGTPDDFDGLLRSDGAPDAGAYERSDAGAPGWVIAATFKELPGGPVVPPLDGDTGDPGDASDTTGDTATDTSTGDTATDTGGDDVGSDTEPDATASDTAADGVTSDTATPDTGTGSDTGAPPGDREGSEDGCGCRTVSAPPGSPNPAALALFAALLLGIRIGRHPRTRR